MKKLLIITLLAGTGMFGAIGVAGLAFAQVAGSTTTVGVAVTESSQLASGWSVKRTILGATIYNEAGEKVGKVKDLIIAPDKQVSYVIIGAGGFVGIGVHDVAIPVTQIENRDGRMVMPGASKASIKALPRFQYANKTAKRDVFIANTEAELSKSKEQIASLQKKADAGTAEIKAALESKINAAQTELDDTQSKLNTLKNASSDRWKEFEGQVTNANRRLHKTLGSLDR